MAATNVPQPEGYTTLDALDLALDLVQDSPVQSAPRSRKTGRGKAAGTITLGRQAHDILASSRSPMTLRQLYYALVSVDAIPKYDAAYGKLKRVMRDLREDGRRSNRSHEYDLPSRPPKASDVRTAKFGNRATVEVEALPVDILLGLVEAAIVELIDQDALAVVQEAEASERVIARRIGATPVHRLLEAAS